MSKAIKSSREDGFINLPGLIIKVQIYVHKGADANCNSRSLALHYFAKISFLSNFFQNRLTNCKISYILRKEKKISVTSTDNGKPGRNTKPEGL